MVFLGIAVLELLFHLDKRLWTEHKTKRVKATINGRKNQDEEFSREVNIGF